MSGTTEEKVLNFRRYKDGNNKAPSLRDKIFQSSWSYKCPTYVQSTAPCQGSCPAGEDIRGYLAITRGTEKAPAGVPWQDHVAVSAQSYYKKVSVTVSSLYLKTPILISFIFSLHSKN